MNIKEIFNVCLIIGTALLGVSSIMLVAGFAFFLADIFGGLLTALFFTILFSSALASSLKYRKNIESFFERKLKSDAP